MPFRFYCSDSLPASGSGASTPLRGATVSSHSATTPLLRSAGASGSGNILAAAARSVSQGNLGGYGGTRGLQPSVSCFNENLFCASMACDVRSARACLSCWHGTVHALFPRV